MPAGILSAFSLNNGENMQIYKYNISDASESKLKEWFNAMSDERRKETMRLADKKKRASKIIADFLYRKAISDFCGVNPAEIEFIKNGYGKPFAKNLPVYFSISHSGDMVVCAVSGREIGIDIEKIRPIKLKSAEKFASADELEYICSSENGFFEIWTLKEAFFKCIGTGLGADIKTVTFDIQETIKCSENGFELSFIKAENGYICSVCSRTDD